MFNPSFLKRLAVFCAGLSLIAAPATWAAERVMVRGHVPEAVANLRALSHLTVETNLNLALGLPLHNTAELTNLLQDLSDPTSPRYRRYLTPEQFTEQFGPTEEDYQKVRQFAEAHGLSVRRTHGNRMLIDVTGPVANIEEAFQVKLNRYQHPTENREFFAPDREPTVDVGVPLLHVGGLDNYIVPHPMDIKQRDASDPIPDGTTGSGPGGSYTGKDFRPCYVPGVTNIGTGQTIALIEFGQYYTNDVYKYQTNAGIAPGSIAISNILIDVSGTPAGTNYDDGEEALDIDMSMALAPGARLLVYEGGPSDDLMNQIATDNEASQISLSWGFGIDATTIQIFQEYLAQGQTFSQASGDGGADTPNGGGLTGMPYATICGGTALTTTGPAGAWKSETTWIGSGGGVSSYGIPPWQEGISMTSNQGSTTNRNFPDIAMLADTVIFWYLKNGTSGEVGGTSASTPEWTAVMALANQQAAAEGLPRIGYINPAIYQIGKGAGALSYAKCFHDVTTGNNFSSSNPTLYSAKTGYDLCTGWGSPIGSNLIAALVGVGTNDFALLASEAGITIVRGGSATTLLTVAGMNGFDAPVTFQVSGMPTGVTATLSPTTSTSQSILAFSTAPSAVPGTTKLTVTATSGALTHVLTMNLLITEAIPGETQVNLASYFNKVGIYADGSTFASGGIDGDGSAYSGNLLGQGPNANGLLFTLGETNANNVISTAAQTITLPQGEYTSVQILATAVNGDQANQSFTVTYTDNSTTVIKQSISDWFTPANYAGETIAAAMPYRINSDGSQDLSTFNVYTESLPLNGTKTVKSITLPNNANVKVLAITLVNAPVLVNLSSLFNRAGMYTDGTTFTNPPTGGLDGGGYAYAASVLGSQILWNGVPFEFGPANKTNVISCAGQTAALPSGSFWALRMLGTGYDGGQVSKNFVVTYTDGTTKTFTQSMSDWFTPSSYAGESKAVTMGYRIHDDGTKDSRTFYLYGYSFNLDPTKVPKSVQLPTDANAIVVSMSLVPDVAPEFTENPFSEPDAQAGQTYTVFASTNASEMIAGDAITFGLVSGPAWLSVTANGELIGTPGASDVGSNTFVISVTDAGGLAADATLNINVDGQPAITQAATITDSTNLVLTWSGGTGPYYIQVSTNLEPGSWTNLSGPLSSNTFSVPTTNGAAFYRIVGE